MFVCVGIGFVVMGGPDKKEEKKGKEKEKKKEKDKKGKDKEPKSGFFFF